MLTVRKVSTLRELKKDEVIALRALCKANGVKGCRKGNFYHIIGKQLEFIKNPDQFINVLIENGFYIDGYTRIKEAAELGYLSTMLIAKEVKTNEKL